MNPFWISLETAAAATAATFVLGIAAAWTMSRWHGRARGLVDGLLTLPLVLPPTVVGYFLLLLFGGWKKVSGWLTALGISGNNGLITPTVIILIASAIAAGFIYYVIKSRKKVKASK